VGTKARPVTTCTMRRSGSPEMHFTEAIGCISISTLTRHSPGHQRLTTALPLPLLMQYLVSYNLKHAWLVVE
jgi:hypothetical protein